MARPNMRIAEAIRKRRKARLGEVICQCGAYGFPHRMMGGRCSGGAFVYQFFQKNMHGECKQCFLCETRTEPTHEIVCQVDEGREDAIQCPALDEHVQFNEIKLYGVNKPYETSLRRRTR